MILLVPFFRAKRGLSLLLGLLLSLAAHGHPTYRVATATPALTAPATGSTTTGFPSFGGTAPAGSTVTIYLTPSGGSTQMLGTAVANGSGTFGFIPAAALSSGVVAAYVTAELSGQGVSANSNTNTFMVDATPPAAAVVNTPADGSTTNTGTPTFTGTAEPGSLVYVQIAGPGVPPMAAPPSVTADAGGSWTYTWNLPALTDGTYTVRAHAVDAVGNPGPTGNTNTFTIDTSDNTTWKSGSAAGPTDWFDALNWTNGVPSASLNAIVVLPATNGFQPLIASGSAVARSLTVAANATLSMSGGSLDVQGDLTNNGTLVPTGGTVILGSVPAQNGPSILGSSRVRFWNLTLNSGGVLLATSAGASIRHLATLSGALVTQGNELVLESEATGTALTVNNPGGTYFGLVTVQRYLTGDLNAGAGYRHLAPPVGLSTVGGLATTGFTPVVNAAYNTSADPVNVAPFPRVFAYDQARLATASNNLSAFSKGWASPTALSDNLEPGYGYSVNVAANRSVSFVGGQNNGDLTRTLARNSGATAGDAGWHHVGNPYPAPLDYALVAPADRVNLDAAIYVFESTSQYGGNYRSYVNGVGNSILPMAQGFWVRVAAGQTSGSLTFRNAQRLTSYANPTFHRSSTSRPLVQLDLQGANGSDPLYVYFEQGATAGTDREYDAVKLPNTSGLNLSAGNGSDELAIDGLPVLTASVVVPLQVRVPATGSYTLHAAQLLNLSTTHAYLRDRQTGIVVDLSQQPDYTFRLNAAYTGQRFELVFAPQTALATAPASLIAQVAVFPNPAHKAVFVELPAALSRPTVTASLVDALGRVVLTQPLTADGSPLVLDGVAAGVYALRLQTTQGTITKKLTVE